MSGHMLSKVLLRYRERYILYHHIHTAANRPRIPWIVPEISNVSESRKLRLLPTAHIPAYNLY